ncbi:hypothetical protein BGZ58_003560 [Dissophora ornata]|nr:hypothetical protein BGZ58_003560 [Dissophora ornata]
MSVFARNPTRLFNAVPRVSQRIVASPRPSLYRQQPVAVAMRTFSTKNDVGASIPGQTQSNAVESKDPSSTAKPLGKVSGIVNSILHGSGSLPKVQSQESWGVSLARGKYIHELQRHRIRPERFDDYVQLV